MHFIWQDVVKTEFFFLLFLSVYGSRGGFILFLVGAENPELMIPIQRGNKTLVLSKQIKYV